MKLEDLLVVSHLKKHFDVGKGQTLKAVNDVSFTIKKGETFGLVGESGCGKSTLGRTLIRLYQKTAGEVSFNGVDVFRATEKQKDQLTRHMQMIFQDPYASLNPRATVMDSIAEGMDIQGLNKGKKRKERVHELLRTVGLNEEHAQRYPHEFSGGQRQRIGIARALALEPQLIIADEPISALDVSIQAQVVNLLKQLQKERGLTYLFIAHDLSMVKHISDRIAVMYLGQIVELTDSDSLYANPLHPYTQALLSAIPIPDPDIEDKRERIILKGELPSPIDPPSGCVFRTRCAYAMEVCAESTPSLKEWKEGHFAACHLLEETGAAKETAASRVHS
ncbi:ABC transporter ATP-binding protein [Alkalicoccobacillus murimartini]|uniref:Oligopeptide transport system ATP-binding protein n=1 Tax=Alkalicoccobacillus murimartini TaxID=171685 RepID=A0ABT9YIV8_9BACI|nr:dipeptide ABC transporter ATP-binding protein [Alkalicoccobacillus murimartini]MDQ0207798.1 oligopeptide transport system ATP-binding protein [Alkalicoccobacillus murimartini]